MGERERERIYGKDGDGQSPLESQHYRKDRIYGKDGEDVTAKLACYYVPVHVDVSAKCVCVRLYIYLFLISFSGRPSRTRVDADRGSPM